jgi:DHA1 family tetracycline resistance protein-like MFS transporter
MSAQNSSNTFRNLLVMLFFDMMSISLIVPLITPFIRELGVTPSQLGMISSVYGLTQLISSPILGRMSDKLSRRGIILVSLIGSAFGYMLLGFARTIAMVVASRFIVGTFRQTSTITKAWVTDIGFAAAAGRGYANGDSKVVNPKSLQPRLDKPSKLSKSWFHELATLKPKVRGLMIVRFFIGISIMLSRNGIFMLMEYKLDMDVSNKGYVMSIYSIGGVVTQLIIVPFLDSCTKLTNKHLVVCSAVILASLQFMLGLIVSPNLFYAVIVGLAVSSSVLKVAMSNALSTAAGKTNKGEVLGVAGSVMSVCRAIAPMASGMLVESYDSAMPGFVAAGSMIIAALIAPVFVPDDVNSSSTSTYLSWFYATSSLGFMIGPALGGNLAMISEYGVRLPFLISTVLFLINAAAVITTLPPGKIQENALSQNSTATSFQTRLHDLVRSNNTKIESLEKKILLLSGKKKAAKDALGTKHDDVPLLQLNQVLTNRAASNIVALELQKNDIAAKESMKNELITCNKRMKSGNSNRKPKTLLDAIFYWLYEVRFPAFIAMLYLIYFRRTKSLK